MLENVTIDSVLKHYNAIDSDRLSENKINIDENLQVEDSFLKYLQLFASFLNESYYRGYIISQPIIKRLMDIIEYEGYEYQIIEKYTEILFDAMYNDIQCDEANRPEYRKVVLSPEDSKEFINTYLERIKNLDLLEDCIYIPHFKNPESNSEEQLFDLRLLIEVEYPIDFIYKTTKTYSTVDAMYIIYKNNLPAYRSLVNKFKNDPNKIASCIFFLLDETDDESLDILVYNTKSLHQLAQLISFLYYYNQNTSTDTINNNIRRLIELLTINVTIEQTAMMISQDYELWKSYNTNNPHELPTLSMAIDLYENNMDKYTIIDPYKYIQYIPIAYNNDVYFYARQALLNMDYNVFCEKFINIYTELFHCIEHDKLINIFDECIIGLSALNNHIVNNKLFLLVNDIKEKTSYIESEDIKHFINLIITNIENQESTN